MVEISNEQHLTQEQLLRYVEDDCSRSEMREIDRHLTNCEMCSDAVEGLMLLSEPSVVLDNLNTRIDAKVAEKTAEKIIEQPFKQPVLSLVKRPFWQQGWAAAAAVLLLASSSIWIYKNTQQSKKQEVTNIETPVLPNSELKANDITPPQYPDVLTTKKDDKTPVSHIEKKEKDGVAETAIGNNSNTQKPEWTVVDNDAKKRLSEFFDKEPKDDLVVQKANNVYLPNSESGLVLSQTSQNSTQSDTKTTSTGRDGDGVQDPKAITVVAPTEDRFRDYAGASYQNTVPRPTTPSVETTVAKTKDANILKEEVDVANVSKLKEAEKKQVGYDKNRENVATDSEYKPKNTRDVTIPARKPAPTATVANPSATVVTFGDTVKAVGTYPSPKKTVATNDANQILREADSYFKQKYYETAATRYSLFSTLETSGKRYDRARFQAATCYLKLNRKAEAKALFEQLAQGNGQYKQAAKKALKGL